MEFFGLCGLDVSQGEGDGDETPVSIQGIPANHVQDVALNPTEGQSIVELRREEGDGDAVRHPAG